ncbi:MAG: asparagine synthase (glutamine-hydrolyzing) [Christensenellales bacterium]
MCGFAGVVNYKRNISMDKQVIEDMTQTLIHRGPDDFGYFISEHALLGHRRLVVVDPEGGAQPMKRMVNDYAYTIVYNGELYNTGELRVKLAALHFTFESYSDTEVLLCSYIAWGPLCTKYLNGIFSFAIWDEKNERIFLCRDHLGVKPLYYSLQDDTLLFGSEIKAVLAYPMMEALLDGDGICEIMGLGPAHSLDNGVFKDIRQLPAAHYLLYTRSGAITNEYWTLKNEDHTENEQQTCEHVRLLLQDAIKRQLFADVPVCSFLSGGLDSSIISAVAAKEFREKGYILDTFSIDYENNNQYYKTSDFTPASDDAWVDMMSGHIGSRHHRIILNNQDLITALSDAMYANDLPGMADIDSSLLLFCREVRKRATVALSGECADEIFGGYPWYVREDLAYAGTFPWSGAVDERQKLLAYDLQRIRLSDYVQAKYESTIKKAPTSGGMPQEEAAFKKLFYLNVKWFMNTLLTRKDRMSMATNLEVRVPFADYRLVEYAFNIPRASLLCNNREKGLLRKSMAGIVPDEILWRKKSPYPKTFHPAYTQGVQSWMNEILHTPSSPLLQIIDKHTVQEIVDTEGRAFGRPWFGQLMKGPQLIAYLIQFNEWMKRFKVRVVL